MATVAETTFEGGMDFGLWRKLFRYTKPYKRHVTILAFTAMTTAASDVSFPLVTRKIIDDAAAAGTAGIDLPYYAGLYLLLTLVLCTSIYVFIHMAGTIRTHVSHDIRRDGFDRLQDLSFAYYDHRPVGWLMARMTSDCERLSNILAWGVLDFVWGSTLMTGITIAMFLMDPRLAVLVLAVFPFLLLVSGFFKKRILRASRIVRKTNSRITGAYNESIMGVRTTKVFVREDANLTDFGRLTTEMYDASVRNQLLSALYLPILLTLGSLATGIALVVGGLDVVAGTVSIGTLVAFMTYTRHFFDPVQEMAHWFAEMQMAQASAERILGVIETEPEIRDSDAVRARVAEHTEPDEVGRICFEGVSFAYEAGQTVLEDFDLEVEPGSSIALVGSTGGGKSTIVSLLCRFYEPTSGRITIGGTDYTERSLHWLQSKLGIVLQSPHLFSGTIRENIRYGRLDASDTEVEEAARLVGADEFITAMEHGYASEVGEGGNQLSTGQKQLVSFARALLAAPQILVMDEATSSIDTETEQKIQRGLERVLEGRTSFVIAHRLSTVRSVDRILVIENGHIAEQGTHHELLRLRGRYYELYRQGASSFGVATPGLA